MIRVTVDGTDISAMGHLLTWPNPVTEIGRTLAVVPKLAAELGYTPAQAELMECGPVTPSTAGDSVTECKLYRNGKDARLGKNPIARLIIHPKADEIKVSPGDWINGKLG